MYHATAENGLVVERVDFCLLACGIRSMNGLLNKAGADCFRVGLTKSACREIIKPKKIL